MRNFPSHVEKYFTCSLHSFVSPHGHVISSIYVENKNKPTFKVRTTSLWPTNVWRHSLVSRLQSFKVLKHKDQQKVEIHNTPQLQERKDVKLNVVFCKDWTATDLRTKNVHFKSLLQLRRLDSVFFFVACMFWNQNFTGKACFDCFHTLPCLWHVIKVLYYTGFQAQQHQLIVLCFKQCQNLVRHFIMKPIIVIK